MSTTAPTPTPEQPGPTDPRAGVSDTAHARSDSSPPQTSAGGPLGDSPGGVAAACDTTAIGLDRATLRPRAWTAIPRAIWPMAVGVVIAWLLHEFVGPALGGFGTLLVFAGINIILAVSLNIVNGYAGQFSIGHAGFMALGGYAAGAIVYYGSYRIWGDARFHGGELSWIGRAGGFEGPPVAGGELLFIGACLAAGVIAAAAGWIVGLPSLRLRGDYLAIVTLGFGEIVRVVLQGTDRQFRGSADIETIRSTPFYKLLYHVGGSQSFSSIPPYATTFWIYVWVAVMLVVAVRLKYSGYGRALLSIREDEIAARACGVNVTRYKVRAFMLAAFFAGVAGALTALHVGQMNAGELGFQRSFEIVIIVVLGGLGSVSGAVLAAVLLTILPELLRDPPGLWPWGLALAAVIAALIALRSRRKLRGLIVLAAVCGGYELIRWAAPVLHINLADYRMVIYSLVLILTMVMRPQGLLGVAEVWDLWPLNRIPWLAGHVPPPPPAAQAVSRGVRHVAAATASSRKAAPTGGTR